MLQNGAPAIPQYVSGIVECPTKLTYLQSTPSSAEPLSRANSVLDASFAHRSSLHAPRTCRWLLEPTTYLQDDAGILSLWLVRAA